MTQTAEADESSGSALNDTLRLLAILQDGRFHSGEELGSALGISRSGVWKKIKKINTDLGVVVHSVTGRGYKLAQQMTALAPEAAFKGRNFSWDVILFRVLDSTNAEALRRLEMGAVAPFVVVAEQQTAGRGRRGRVWVSPFGENLYFTLAIKIDQGARQLEGLSLVVGLAVLKALRNAGVVGAGLKWPNDVLASGRKLAGVLLELVGDLADVCHVVIGIGINVNMLNSTEEIDQQWTSVSIETGKLIDRNMLLAELQIQLDDYLALHLKHGFSSLSDEWETNNLWHGQSVVLSAGEQNVSGIIQGVDSSGALRLLIDGVLRTFSGGEISLRLKHDT